MGTRCARSFGGHGSFCSSVIHGVCAVHQRKRGLPGGEPSLHKWDTRSVRDWSRAVTCSGVWFADGTTRRLLWLQGPEAPPPSGHTRLPAWGRAVGLRASFAKHGSTAHAVPQALTPARPVGLVWAAVNRAHNPWCVAGRSLARGPPRGPQGSKPGGRGRLVILLLIDASGADLPCGQKVPCGVEFNLRGVQICISAR